MLKASVPLNDYLRVKNLQALEILDTPDEALFTDLVRVTSFICHTPISMISLLDDSRSWVKAAVGTGIKEIPRDLSFCSHVIAMEDDFFEVEDALNDERFFDNPLVISKPGIRFYAGVPLVSREGSKVGALCVSDTQPNKLTKGQVFALKSLGNCIDHLLEFREIKKQSEEKGKKITYQTQVMERLLFIISHDANLYQKSRILKRTR